MHIHFCTLSMSNLINLCSNPKIWHPKICYKTTTQSISISRTIYQLLYPLERVLYTHICFKPIVHFADIHPLVYSKPIIHLGVKYPCMTYVHIPIHTQIYSKPVIHFRNIYPQIYSKPVIHFGEIYPCTVVDHIHIHTQIYSKLIHFEDIYP